MSHHHHTSRIETRRTDERRGGREVTRRPRRAAGRRAQRRRADRLGEPVDAGHIVVDVERGNARRPRRFAEPKAYKRWPTTKGSSSSHVRHS